MTLIPITQELIDNVCHQAHLSERKRKNYNFHSDLSDPIQRLLNALEPDSYVCPHKHEDPDKREVFLILQGSLTVVLFDENGNITSSFLLDRQKGHYGAEIPAKVFHSIVVHESNTIYYEFKDGPYNPLNDKDFASWAPRENQEGATAYLAWMKKAVS